jgi:hypothetical protein
MRTSSDDNEQQPGFVPAHKQQHLGRVKFVCCAGRGTFVSLTSSALKTWTTIQQGAETAAPIELAHLQLPRDFVTAVAPCGNLLLGSCLDGSLRVWSLDRLAQRSICPLELCKGVATQLLYNPRCMVTRGMGAHLYRA